MGDDERKCPRCAETIKRDAAACRFCNANLAAGSQWGPPRPINPRETIKTISPAVLGLLAAVAVSWIGSAVSVDTAGTTEPTKIVEQFGNVKRAECADAVTRAKRRGLVKEIPSADRVIVDDVQWALLPASEKEALLALLACSAFGVGVADLEPLQSTSAYGWRSGKMLAMLGSTGMTIE